MSVLAARKEKLMKNELAQITKTGAIMRRSKKNPSLSQRMVITDPYSKPAKEKNMLRLANISITCPLENPNALIFYRFNKIKAYSRLTAFF